MKCIFEEWTTLERRINDGLTEQEAAKAIRRQEAIQTKIADDAGEDAVSFARATFIASAREWRCDRMNSALGKAADVVLFGRKASKKGHAKQQLV